MGWKRCAAGLWGEGGADPRPSSACGYIASLIPGGGEAFQMVDGYRGCWLH